jgi:hypothetical protein
MNEIIDDSGVVRKLGLLAPEPGFVSSFPLFSSAVAVWPESDVRAMARSGLMDGRKKFDDSWIKNQRDKGSCAGFAAASALSRARVARGLERVDLSGAYLYSLVNRGRDQGSLLDEGMMALQSRGVATEATVPWDRIFPSQYDRVKADAEAAKYKGFECYQTRSRAELYAGVAMGYFGVVAVHVGNNFMRVDRNTMIAGADNGIGNHAVLVDGIATEGDEIVLTAANSWDLTWGVRGRMNLTWERHLAQPNRHHPYYLIRSTTDGDDTLPLPN